MTAIVCRDISTMAQLSVQDVMIHVSVVRLQHQTVHSATLFIIGSSSMEPAIALQPTITMILPKFSAILAQMAVNSVRMAITVRPVTQITIKMALFVSSRTTLPQTSCLASPI